MSGVQGPSWCVPTPYRMSITFFDMTHLRPDLGLRSGTPLIVLCFLGSIKPFLPSIGGHGLTPQPLIMTRICSLTAKVLRVEYPNTTSTACTSRASEPYDRTCRSGISKILT